MLVLLVINLILSLTLIIIEAHLMVRKKRMHQVSLVVMLAALYIVAIYVHTLIVGTVSGVEYTRPATTLMIAANLARGIYGHYTG